MSGHGRVGNDTPIGPSYRYFDADLEQTPYDPEKAKWFLKQSGLSGLAIDLSAADSAYAGAVDSAVLYREHALKAGIDITVVREPNDGYPNDWFEALLKDIGRSENWFLDHPEDDFLSDDEWNEMKLLIKTASGRDGMVH